jgi:HEAT repeat protein
MDRMSLSLALAGMLALSGGGWSTVTPSRQASAPQEPAASMERGPRAPWLQGDPADSIYRAAREALDRRDYRRAADLFAQVPARYPRSGYAPDAYYWRAFALYRVGGTPQLRLALQSLDAQRERHPRAATRGDAQALARRIQGELARQGDAEAAAQVAEAAEAAVAPTVAVAPAVAAAPMVAETPPVPPVPPTGSRGRDRCDDEDDDTKLAALSALQQMDDERARPILQRVLARRDPSSVCLRRKAVFLIAQEDASGAEDILLEAARSDPDRDVREQAVFWLSQVGTDRAVGALDSILRTSNDPSLQEKAVFALSQHGSARALQALRGYAERPGLSLDVREKVIFWLGQSGGAENEAFLRSLYGRLDDTDLRNKVLFSLAQAGGPENIRFLLGVVRDSRQPADLRKQALFWAGQADAPMADLAALYDALPDRAMREQLVFVYSQRDDAAAVDKLLDVARNDPDRELRKKALFWLGQSNDPRAAKALQDIIERP